MATKPKSKKPVTDDEVIDAALQLAVERGWSHIGMGDIAEAAKISIADLYVRFPSKIAVQTAFMRRIDAEVLGTTGRLSDDESATDRLFEVLMARFDALAPHKSAVRAILKGAPNDPAAVLCGLPQLRRSFKWMLTAAGLRPDGMRGEVTVKVVIGVWLNAVRVWLNDDDPDLSRTMATLDRGLKGVARFGCFGRRRRGGTPDSPGGGGEEAAAA